MRRLDPISFTGRVARSIGVALLATLALLAAGTATAQVPSADQMAIFQNLTPEQQQALIEQASRGASGGSAASTTRSSGAGGSRLDPRQEEVDRRAARRQAQTAEDEPLIPRFDAEDTVLVQVELPTRRLVQLPDNGRGGQMAPSPSVPGVGNSAPGANPLQWLEPEELEAEERRKLEALRDLIRSRNPYRLDRDGQLVLPGFSPIALGGLTEAQATQRIAAEPVLLKLDVKLVRLPLARSGIESLKPFGYDLFDEAPSTFSPVTDIPVPSDYVVGAGDELSVQTFGTQNRTQRLVVSRDGTISFPELGPIRVAGMTFNAAKATIEGRVASQLIGTRANVTMGETRSTRVFVLGEARFPGSYSVSGLATMTAALFASGGVKPIGSLRDIQLKRRGEVVSRLDLYSLLINGDTSGDARLQPGDVIFVPPLGPTVSVAGEVKRPAIYELDDAANVAEVLSIAGGFTTQADPVRATLTRVDEASRRIVLDLDLGAPVERTRALQNGDILRVARLRPQIDSGVLLTGAVHRQGLRAWREGLRLSDVIGSVDELQPNADQGYILIRRETMPGRRIQVLSADLGRALAAPGSTTDIALNPRDQITVFDLEPGRERIIKPLLDELRLQSALDRPTAVVRVEGRIKVPGEYPLEPGMRISDLLRAGGNLSASAYGGKAELARYAVSEGGGRQTELLEVNLAAIRDGDAAADLLLQPFDYLLVKETPNWTEQESVVLQGEVRFPGTYPIRRGETLSQLLARAGGLTTQAFPKGSAFTRLDLKQREQKQLDLLGERLQKDLATMSLQAAAANQAGAAQALLSGQSILAQLKESQAVGRLVIDLPSLIGGDASRDVVLQDGDRLVVPKQKQEVTVIGEVQSVTSHFYSRDLSRDDYVEMSGGITRKGDAKKIYVVRADGSVVTQGSSLFKRSHALAIQPGDTIVVPLDTERMPRLPFWQAVTQIVYNLAISVAAINSF